MYKTRRKVLMTRPTRRASWRPGSSHGWQNAWVDSMVECGVQTMNASSASSISPHRVCFQPTSCTSHSSSSLLSAMLSPGHVWAWWSCQTELEIWRPMVVSRDLVFFLQEWLQVYVLRLAVNLRPRLKTIWLPAQVRGEDWGFWPGAGWRCHCRPNLMCPCKSRFS